MKRFGLFHDDAQDNNGSRFRTKEFCHGKMIKECTSLELCRLSNLSWFAGTIIRKSIWEQHRLKLLTFVILACDGGHYTRQGPVGWRRICP